MSMFGPKKGVWNVSSESDERWNASGEAYGFVTSGGPLEIKEHIERMEKSLGSPPADLTVGFHKY